MKSVPDKTGKLGRSQEDVKIEAIRDAANSILVYLEFTVDIPERNPSGKVPMLDIQVWVQHGEGGADVLAWTFFEKPTASCQVLRASTAYPWRSKLVTLGMEVFRRMRNMSQQMTTQSRIEVLSRVCCQTPKEWIRAGDS